jgi:hypothetical protein
VPARDAAEIVLTASLMAPNAFATGGSLSSTSAVTTVAASPIAICRNETARRLSLTPTQSPATPARRTPIAVAA